MHINRIYSIYFSPTGTTMRVVSAMAQTLSAKLACPVHTFDFTLPKSRTGFPHLTADDLILFGCPTYAGRLPNLLLKYLDTIAGCDALAVPIVTYGNRHFDNSLIELRDILEGHGFHTIAAVAACCEHSFSERLAAGRPDAEDLSQFHQFAASICDRLTASEIAAAQQPAVRMIGRAADAPVTALPLDSPTANAPAFTPVQVPGIPAEDGHGGYYQPRDRHGVFIDIRKVKPKTDAARCLRYRDAVPVEAVQREQISAAAGTAGNAATPGEQTNADAGAQVCGICAAVCPMGAIDAGDVTQVTGICIKCGACIKKCPERAKYYDDPGYLYHKTELEEMYQRRGENYLFL